MTHLLIATDFSECAEQALEAAKSLLTVLSKDGIRITMLTVVEDTIPTGIQFEFGIAPIDSATVVAAATKHAAAKLQALRTQHFPTVEGGCVCLQNNEGVDSEIVRYAREHQVDMMILATHGRRGLRRLIAGSVTERVLHTTPCPLLVVPPQNTLHADRYGTTHIVVSTDLSKASERAMPIARKLFDAYDSAHARLTLLYIAENMVDATFNIPLGESVDAIRSELEERANARLEELRMTYFGGTLATTTIIRGERPPAEELRAYVRSHHANLLVIASQGHGAFDRLVVGSVTEKLVRRSECCVLVVPPS